MANGVNRNDPTAQRHSPLPHPDNTMQADILRIRAATEKIDADMAAQAAQTRRRWVHDFVGLKL